MLRQRSKRKHPLGAMYIPPGLLAEVQDWLQQSNPGSRDWLFPSPKGRPWGLQNYLNRVLTPAAIRANVGVFTRTSPDGDEVEATDVNFQVLRQTCGTLFGAKLKIPGIRKPDSGTPIRRSLYVIIRNRSRSVRTAAVALKNDLIRRRRRNNSERALNRSLLRENS